MNAYTLSRSQILPISIETAWAFFSDPRNLSRITPPQLSFTMLTVTDGTIFEGMILKYRVKPILGIPLPWVSLIRDVHPPFSFMDEQLQGPYAFWQHQHEFRAVKEGVEVVDIVRYVLPLGVVGRLGHALFVRRQLEGIFSYRQKVLEHIFPSGKGGI